MRAQQIILACLVSVTIAGIGFGQSQKPVLRVYADPNNLPFCNEKQEGFENRIAELVARELGMELHYNWQALRQGFFRRAFRDADADVIIGVPTGIDVALTTQPYYRSTYVFVTRKDRNLGITSLDDPQLHNLKIGAPIVGAETSNTPPILALGHRGIIDNVIGYTVYGDYDQNSPPARMVDAVSKKEVDVAILWGPLAGYFAKRQPVPLVITPVTPQIDAGIPFTYSISLGVQKTNTQLRDRINAVLTRKQSEIDKILDEYGVPRMAAEDSKGAARATRD